VILLRPISDERRHAAPPITQSAPEPPSSPPRSSVLTAALTALTAARVGELGAGTVLVVALLGRALPP
jgi:hypothetical protein